MKFDVDDPEGIFSMLKIFSTSFKSLKGHYEVTSGLKKQAPMGLKFDMNDF